MYGGAYRDYKKETEKRGRLNKMAGTFIICNNEDEIESNRSCWGNVTFELSAEDIVALFCGKTLAANNGEYGIFIKLEESNNAEN